MQPETLEAGYWSAYRDFYRWGSILQAANTKPDLLGKLRHLAYTGGWKKAEPLWEGIIHSGSLPRLLPILETVLEGIHPAKRAPAPAAEPV
jgi:hypothetical protein